MRIFIVFLVLSFFKVNCNDDKIESSTRASNFKLFTNYELSGNNLEMEANIDEAYENGVSFPTDGSFFKFSFNVNNNEEAEKNYYYKIYYQNRSYKFPEYDTSDGGKYNVYAAENFYGSWVDTDIGFKLIEEVKEGESKMVLDSFKIVGNPRNELKYFGTPVMNKIIEEAAILRKMNNIPKNPKWFNSVKEKAKKNKVSLQDQLYVDAKWMLDSYLDPPIEEVEIQDSILRGIKKEIEIDEKWKKAILEKAKANKTSFESQLVSDVNWIYKQRNPRESVYVNNRKKRNPRMGEYEFMLVILTEEELAQIPTSISNINQRDTKLGEFLNPFYYFNYKFTGSKKSIINGNEVLRVQSKFKANNGVYIDPLSLKNRNSSKEYYNNLVGSSKYLYRSAHYEQYFHTINKNFSLKNVPVSADVTGGEYSRELFNKNKERFKEDARRTTYTKITNTPGKTVYYDSSSNAIKIINPGNTDPSKWVKENVGVKTRVGFSYGRYTGKIKFAETMNEEGVWNGLTSAFWLFSEELKKWNERNTCYAEGYIPKSSNTSDIRFKKSNYSEIDIEIVKTSKHWPKTSYGGIEDYPIDNPEENNNLIVTCTNWDLACQDPENFNQGVKFFDYEEESFGLHRWVKWYPALTSKYERPHDETVGGIYYYQIDWRPTEIIWRVGTSLDNMKTVSYMSSKNTKIPNNQMIAIVTQEFHYADWWPLSPYDQNNVPFPSKDIEGYVYEITVE